MVGREKYMDPKGDWRVRGAWNGIVAKVKVLTRCFPIFSFKLIFALYFLLQDAHIRAGNEYTAWFHQQVPSVNDARVQMELFAFRWSKPPRFLRSPGK